LSFWVLKHEIEITFSRTGIKNPERQREDVHFDPHDKRNALTLPHSPKNSASEGISGYVLAGGHSSRLGQDKVLLPWNGQTLLNHAIQRLQQVCLTVRVCSDRNDLLQHLPSQDSSSSGWLIRDALPEAGPLSGIVAALEKSQTEWNLFLAVDLPLVPNELLKALAARAESNRLANAGGLCVIPKVEGLPQPLCGLYHRSLAPGLRRALKEGKYKIMLAMQEALLEISGSRMDLFDVEDFTATVETGPATLSNHWFLNINTPEDWQRACGLASR
jgi:molybdopterin-guanine dinucleotide biosynthesis protein A